MTVKNYIIEDSRESGFKTVAVISADGKKSYLHSKISPSREASAFSDIFSSLKGDTVILLGLGLGHHLHDIAKASAVKTIIAIEKIDFTPEEMSQYFTWVSKVISLKISFIVGKNYQALDSDLESSLKIREDTSVAIIEHPASVRTFPDYYAHVRESIQKLIRKKVGNIVTVHSFAGLFIKNCIKKIVTLPHYFPFKALEKSFTDKPCIIISSAPSVDSYIALIAKYQKNFIIISVDSAVPILQTHAIKPDLIFSTDPQPWTEEHLLNAEKDIPFIIPLSAHFTVRKKQAGFVYLNTHPFSQIAEHHHPDIGNADSKTGTVVGDALYAATLMGFSQIYITGVDFSFPNHCIYSKDSYYNYRYTSIFNSRLVPCETLHMKYIRRSPHTLHHNSVVTRSSFLQFKDAISGMIKNNNISQITLLSDAGLSIEGTNSISSKNDAEKILSSFSELNNKQSLLRLIIEQAASLENAKLIKTLHHSKIFEQIIIEASSLEHTAKKGIYYSNLFTKLSGTNKCE